MANLDSPQDKPIIKYLYQLPSVKNVGIDIIMM